MALINLTVYEPVYTWLLDHVKDTLALVRLGPPYGIYLEQGSATLIWHYANMGNAYMYIQKGNSFLATEEGDASGGVELFYHSLPFVLDAEERRDQSGVSASLPNPWLYAYFVRSLLESGMAEFHPDYLSFLLTESSG